MPSMSAILRIDARTSGQQGLKELDGLVRRIGPGAEGSVGGVSRLSQALGNMGTIAGGIGLANLGGRMIAFAGDAVQAGDETLLVDQRMQNLAGQLGETSRLVDFASQSADRFTLSQLDASRAVADLYGRLRPMGVGMDDIQSTFNGVNTTARNAGMSLLDAKESFRQLGQAMGSGRLMGDEFRSIMERMPQVGVAIVKVFNDIARNKGLVQITRDRADQMIAEVKTGEKRQTDIMKEQAKERERAAESETDALLREIGKRYDAMRKALGDNYEDMADADSKARNERLDGEREAIDERFDAERKAYERRYQDVRERLSDDETLNDEQKKSVERRLEDEREMILKEIQDRQDAELKSIEETAEKQAKVQQRALRDRRQQEEEALQEGQRREEESRRGALERQKQDIQASLSEQIEANRKANENIIANVLARVKVTQGDLKRMASEGLITPDILVKAMKELEKVSLVDATPLQKFNTAMANLSSEVGDNLLPVVTPLIEGLAGLVKGFGELPEPLQAAGIGLVAVAGGIAAIKITQRTLGDLGSLVKGFRDLAAVGTIKPFIPTPKINKPFGPQQLELFLPTTKNMPKIPPLKAEIIPDVQPGALSKLMGSLGSIGRAVGSLTLEAGKFFALIGREALLAIPGVARLGAAFTGLRIGATIAGWAGAIGPFVGTFTTAMTGLLAWMTGTFVPAMVGIFSGPVGWIALGVAAVIAGLVFFREPIMKFFGWALGEVGKFWKGIFEFIYNTQVKPWVDLWNNVLQKPITQFIGWLWKVTEPVRNLFVNLGTIASEGIRFIFNLFNDILIKPLLSLAEWAFKGLISLGYTVFIQPWIMLWDAVKKPLADLWQWLGETARVAFNALIQIGYELFIEPWVLLWDKIKKPLADLWDWLGKTSKIAFDALVQIGYDIFIKPWVQLWDTIKKPISDLYGWIQSGIKKTFEEINKFGNEKFIKPWGELWALITEEPAKFQGKVRGWFDTLYDGILKKWNAIPAFLQSVWDNVVNGMGRTWSWMVNAATGKLNELLGLWNRVAEGVNKLPTPFKFPIIPLFTQEQIPGFARGGFIDKPTLGMIGEGRNPREYIIPESSMDAATDGWRRGLRNEALVNAWQSPGLAPGRASMEPSGGGMGGQMIIPEVSIQVQQSGPTYRLPDGTDTISRAEAMALVAEASRLTLQAVVRANAGAAARSARRG